MRWIALLVVLAGATAGCVDGNFALDDDFQCPGTEPAVDTASGQYDLLMPSNLTTASQGTIGQRLRVEVDALEGQSLIATASYVPSMGDVRVLFDAPVEGIESRTSNTYTWVGDVPAGHYTLEIEGAPIAYQVTASLSLIATGCGA